MGSLSILPDDLDEVLERYRSRLGGQSQNTSKSSGVLPKQKYRTISERKG